MRLISDELPETEAGVAFFALSSDTVEFGQPDTGLSASAHRRKTLVGDDRRLLCICPWLRRSGWI